MEYGKLLKDVEYEYETFDDKLEEYVEEPKKNPL